MFKVNRSCGMEDIEKKNSVMITFVPKQMRKDCNMSHWTLWENVIFIFVILFCLFSSINWWRELLKSSALQACTEKCFHYRCFSYIGQAIPNGQDLSMGTGCDHVYIAEHELLHALGFYHEQSRYDRDDYVTIKFDNILEGFTPTRIFFLWSIVIRIDNEFIKICIFFFFLCNVYVWLSFFYLLLSSRARV